MRGRARGGGASAPEGSADDASSIGSIADAGHEEHDAAERPNVRPKMTRWRGRLVACFSPALAARGRALLETADGEGGVD